MLKIFCTLFLIAFYLFYKLDFTSDWEFVLFNLRLPRMMLALSVGAALSIAGLIMQNIFHNSLASPYTLGIGSASAFGAALGFYLSLPPIFPALFITIVFIAVILWISLRVEKNILLLLGVIANFFFASLIVALQYLSDTSQVFYLNRWLMGSLNNFDLTMLLALCLFTSIVLAVLLKLSDKLDLILLGEELSLSLGVSIAKNNLIFLLLSGLLVAIVVAVCGPIAFIGIIIPNTVRLYFGSRHKKLLLMSALFGALFLLFSDGIARFLIYPVEIPVGVVTALVGAPWMGWLLVSRG